MPTSPEYVPNIVNLGIVMLSLGVKLIKRLWFLPRNTGYPLLTAMPIFEDNKFAVS